MMSVLNCVRAVGLPGNGAFVGMPTRAPEGLNGVRSTGSGAAMQESPVVYDAELSSLQTSLPPGMRKRSSCPPKPTQKRGSLPLAAPPPSAQTSSWHLPLSHWSSESQLSPGAFNPAAAPHALSLHDPPPHSPSSSQSSPNLLPPPS